jgi:tetratricopeptide (TPR) repeat protein
LVNKSFLSLEPESGRLHVHELLRQYAQERLDASPEASLAAQVAHAAYYAEFTQERWPQLKDHRQMIALADVEADIENVRAAWRYCLDQRNFEGMWKFIHGLWYVYWIRGWNLAGMELFAQTNKVLEDEGNDETVALRALTMAFQGYFMAWLDLPEHGFDLAKQSASILEHHNQPEALGLALESMGLNAYFLNRVTDLIQSSTKVREIATEIDDNRLMTSALYGLSMAGLINEEYDEAQQLAQTSLTKNEEIGDIVGLTFPLIALGHVAYARGEFEDASEFFIRCLVNSEEISFYWAIANACKYLSKVALALGKLDEVKKFLVRSLRLTVQMGFVRDIVNLLYDFACFQVTQAETEQAVLLLTIVFNHPASQHFRWLEGRIRDNAKLLLDQLEEELPQETFASAVIRGQASDLDQVVAELVGLEGLELSLN